MSPGMPTLSDRVRRQNVANKMIVLRILTPRCLINSRCNNIACKFQTEAIFLKHSPCSHWHGHEVLADRLGARQTSIKQPSYTLAVVNE